MNQPSIRGILAGTVMLCAFGIGAQIVSLADHHVATGGPKQGLELAEQRPDGKPGTPSRYRTDARQSSFTTNTKTAVEVAIANSKLRHSAPGEVKDFKIYGALGKTANRAQGALYSLTASGIEKRVDQFRSVDGGAFYDGTNYNVISEMFPGLNIFDLYCYDTQWWYQDSKVGVNSSVTASDMSYDPTSGRVYGCFSNGMVNAKWEFASVDYSSKNQSTIGSSKKKICSIDIWDGVAINAEGTLYVIDQEGILQTVDKTTGRPHVIGSTGLTPYYQGSATFDNDGRLFYSYGPESGPGALYEIDVHTAQATKLIEYPEDVQLVGLFAVIEPIIPEAPARPTELVANFPDNATSGTVSFKLPETLNDGTPGEGEVNWTLKVNGYENSNGTGNYGETVTVDYSSWGGSTVFTVNCSNSAGQGPSAEVMVYIGAEPLSSPTNIRMKRVGNQVTMSWDPVTTTTLGSAVDPSTVRYAVQNSNYEPVGQDIEGNSFTFTVDIPNYATFAQYSLVAYVPNVTQSWTTYAPKVLLGAYDAPWTATLSAETDTDYFQIIDGNNDGYTWGFYGSDTMIAWPSHENNTDEWLFTPGIRLEKGKLYTLSAEIRCYNPTTYPDFYEIKVGDEAVPESMSVTLQETKPATKDYVAESYEFVPNETKVYYFAFHATAENLGAGLYVRNIKVSGASSAATPAEPSMTVETDASGEPKANITLVAPGKDRAGEPLSTISAFALYRDDTQIMIETNVAPGKSFTIADTPEEAGAHVYKAVAQNASGIGKANEQTVYVGVNIAANPANVKAVENSDGNVTVTWDAVTTDQDGNPIRQDFVTYYLLELRGEEQIAIADNLTDTSYTFQAVADDEQQAFKKFAVAAYTKAGYSKAVLADVIPVGKPLTLPYKESFANGMAATPFNVRALVPAYAGAWYIATDETFTDLKCYDGDNGYAYYYGKYIDCPSLLYTGKINLTGADHPVLTFYLIDLYHSMKDKEDFRNTTEIGVMIDLLDGQGFRPVMDTSIAEACDNEGWNKISVDLNDYKGQTVMIGFKGTTKKWVYANIDCIAIGDVIESDLALKYISAPVFTNPDQPFDVVARVENYGSKTAEGALAQLYLNDEVVATEEIPALGVGKKADIVFPQVLSHYHANKNTYRVEIIYEEDMNPDNNVSETAEIEITRTELPPVTDLSASLHEDRCGVDLSWTAPVVEEGALPPYTETFENAGSWSNEVEGWTFIDGDHGGAGGMNTGLVMPGVTDGSEQSWFVIDARLTWLDRNHESSMNFAPYSGNKYIAAIFSMDFSSGPYPTTSVPNDDWAISPELSGAAQTVKFMARSYSPSFLENFEVLYSNDGIDPDDFYTLEEVADVPADAWTEYSFDLPEGARYFAIRYTADYKYMLFVDNVTYTPANPNPLSHLGYDIYRDGIKVNAEPLTECEYTDRFETSDGNYAVCAVYNHGVSSPALMKVQIGNSVEGIDDSHVMVYGGRGRIYIIGAEDQQVSVSTLNGMMIRSTVPTGNMDIEVSTGIYIVRVGSRAYKLSVK